MNIRTILENSESLSKEQILNALAVYPREVLELEPDEDFYLILTQQDVINRAKDDGIDLTAEQVDQVIHGLKGAESFDDRTLETIIEEITE